MSPQSNKPLILLLAADELEEVLALLQQGTWQLSDQQEETVRSLTARLRELRQQETRGIISQEDARLKHLQIKKEIQRIVRMLEPSKIKQARLYLSQIIGDLFKFRNS